MTHLILPVTQKSLFSMGWLLLLSTSSHRWSFTLVRAWKKENVLVAGSSGALIQVPSILIWTKLFENGGRGEFSHFIWNLELLLDLQHDCLRSGVDSEKNGKGHNCLLQSGFYSFTNCQSGKEGKFWLWDNHRYDSLDDESSQDQTPLIKNWQNVVTEPQLGR